MVNSPPGLRLAPWPEQFERDLARIGLPRDTSEASRPRAYLYCRLLDMETRQAVLPVARQVGRLGDFWLLNFEWTAIGYNLPNVTVWFTIGRGRIMAVLAYAVELDVRGRGERVLAIERARAIHGIPGMTLAETE